MSTGCQLSGMASESVGMCEVGTDLAVEERCHCESEQKTTPHVKS